MSTVAIIGAGPLGGALASALAGRARVGEVRLIDPEGRVAEGKALDILQSSPVEAFNTRVNGSDRATPPRRAPTSSSLRICMSGGEIAGEPGLALVRQIARMETDSPFLFAGGGAARADGAGDGRVAAAAAAPAGLGAARHSNRRCARVTRRADGREPGRPVDRRRRRAAARRGHRLGRGDGVQPADRRGAGAASPVGADLAAAGAVAAAALHARERRRARRRGARGRLAPPLHVLRGDRRHRRTAAT